MKVVLRVTGGNECPDCLLNGHYKLLPLATAWLSMFQSTVGASKSLHFCCHMGVSLLLLQLLALHYYIEHLQGQERNAIV